MNSYSLSNSVQASLIIFTQEIKQKKEQEKTVGCHKI